MLKHLFRTMIAARQASAAMQALQYMSDRQLEDIGFTRETFVEKIKADVFAKFSRRCVSSVYRSLISAIWILTKIQQQLACSRCSGFCIGHLHRSCS